MRWVSCGKWLWIWGDCVEHSWYCVADGYQHMPRTVSPIAVHLWGLGTNSNQQLSTIDCEVWWIICDIDSIAVGGGNIFWCGVVWCGVVWFFIGGV